MFFCSATELIALFRDRAEFALLLNKFRDERGPAGLVRRAEARADVAVKIFVKQVTRPRGEPHWRGTGFWEADSFPYRFS